MTETITPAEFEELLSNTEQTGGYEGSTKRALDQAPGKPDVLEAMALLRLNYLQQYPLDPKTEPELQDKIAKAEAEKKIPTAVAIELIKAIIKKGTHSQFHLDNNAIWGRVLKSGDKTDPVQLRNMLEMRAKGKMSKYFKERVAEAPKDIAKLNKALFNQLSSPDQLLAEDQDTRDALFEEAASIARTIDQISFVTHEVLGKALTDPEPAETPTAEPAPEPTETNPKTTLATLEGTNAALTLLMAEGLEYFQSTAKNDLKTMRELEQEIRRALAPLTDLVNSLRPAANANSSTTPTTATKTPQTKPNTPEQELDDDFVDPLASVKFPKLYNGQPVFQVSPDLKPPYSGAAGRKVIIITPEYDLETYKDSLQQLGLQVDKQHPPYLLKRYNSSAKKVPLALVLIIEEQNERPTLAPVAGLVLVKNRES